MGEKRTDPWFIMIADMGTAITKPPWISEDNVAWKVEQIFLSINANI